MKIALTYVKGLSAHAAEVEMGSKESEEWLTPEEWKKKMERKRKKQKKILPTESEIYEMVETSNNRT